MVSVNKLILELQVTYSETLETQSTFRLTDSSFSLYVSLLEYPVIVSIDFVVTSTVGKLVSFASIVSAPNFITQDGKAHMFVNLGPSVHGNGGIDLFSVTDGESFNHLPYDSLVAERGMAHIVTHEQKEKKE